MWKESVDYLTLEIFGLTGRINETINFFIYDTIKIWFLLITIIFVVSYLRTHFNTEYVRVYLQGKSEFTGNVLAALFGIITPFCSCSAIPLFLGFIQARIPIGVTFSFLISSPMNNEIAIALLFGIFGWKITAIYIGFGLLVAIFGGYFIGKMNMQKYILMDVKPMEGELEEVQVKLTNEIKLVLNKKDPIPEILKVAHEHNIETVEFVCKRSFDLGCVFNIRKYILSILFKFLT